MGEMPSFTSENREIWPQDRTVGRNGIILQRNECTRPTTCVSLPLHAQLCKHMRQVIRNRDQPRRRLKIPLLVQPSAKLDQLTVDTRCLAPKQ